MVTKLPQKLRAKAFPNFSNKPFFVSLIELSRSYESLKTITPLYLSGIVALLEDDKYFTVHSVRLN